MQLQPALSIIFHQDMIRRPYCFQMVIAEYTSSLLIFCPFVLTHHKDGTVHRGRGGHGTAVNLMPQLECPMCSSYLGEEVSMKLGFAGAWCSRLYPFAWEIVDCVRSLGLFKKDW